MRRIIAYLIPLILSAAPKTVSTIAGTGVAGFSGDGGPAIAGKTNNPYGLVIGPDGALYFCEVGNHRVRRLDLKKHTLSTLAGTGAPGFSGDGGPAAKAQFKQPHSIAFDPDGKLLVCDIGNNRIRRIDLTTGMIDTYAGTGEKKPAPDGAPLAGTPLNGPRAIDLDPQGNMYLALREGNAVYRIDPKAGKIYHFAGTGEKGYTGDGGDAKLAKLSGPKGISYSSDGGVYIADTESHTIRRIDLKSGVITTVLGTGEPGDGPMGDPLKCKLARPHGVFVHKGIIYVADSESHRVLLLK